MPIEPTDDQRDADEDKYEYDPQVGGLPELFRNIDNNQTTIPDPTTPANSLEDLEAHAKALISIIELPFLTDVEIDECHARAVEIYNGIQRLKEQGEED